MIVIPTMRENVRGSVSDALERKIVSDAKAKGISKNEWVAEACKKAFEKPKPKPAAISLSSEIQEAYRYAVAMREKHDYELEMLLGKIRSLGRN